MIKQNCLIKQEFKKNFKTTPLYEDLISYSAFIGDHYKKIHFSQTQYLLGYRKEYSFYNLHMCIKLLFKASQFLKLCIKEKDITFVFVGNPLGSENQCTRIFKNLNKKFYLNSEWEPGFFSRKKRYSNYVLVVYDLRENRIAFDEAVNAIIPVVGFATPLCDIRGVDYPIILNLKNNKMWYINFCKILFLK
jgi:ribosomal protein S2